MLRKRLGLDLIGGMDLGMEGLVEDRDLIVTGGRRPKLGMIGKQSSSEVGHSFLPGTWIRHVS